ncbi:unnamed protein product [Sphenostylis stenocarpa]|uniref:Uncharacterized protein n=1 Tax=Sphenostylis stenocarpa TaxID=92480 RepID=A0AA86SFZ6_9FABA|nr:unnamed protein product [Sphenostylis stenocarpa]
MLGSCSQHFKFRKRINVMPLMPWATHVLQWTGQRIVIPRGHTALNSFLGLVHAARHTMGASHAQSPYLNRKEGDAEGRASD